MKHLYEVKLQSNPPTYFHGVEPSQPNDPQPCRLSASSPYGAIGSTRTPDCKRHHINSSTKLYVLIHSKNHMGLVSQVIPSDAECVVNHQDATSTI